jgi:hypothetical protein
MIKLLDKPRSILVSVLSGCSPVPSSSEFGSSPYAKTMRPRPPTPRRGWHEIIPAAAVQGTVYGLVKAAVDRGAAEGTHKVTDVRPGGNGEQATKAA